MKTATQFKILACTMLLAATQLAWADKTVTFNVPISVSKLDPTVDHVHAECRVGPDLNNLPNDLAAASAKQPVTNQAYNGNVSVALKIPTAKLSQVKVWKCSLYVSAGNSSGYANPGASSFNAMAPGGTYSVNGTF